MQNKLRELLTKTIHNIRADFVVPPLERTRDSTHGDFASNIALILAKELGKKPREVADLIVKSLPSLPEIEKIEVAGPGFINFYLAPKTKNQTVADILNLGEKYGHSNIAKGKIALVEFVSANPTGPLHVGHGRGAAFGAVVSDLLEVIGYKVEREYYVNDAGRQMHILATSIWLRYLELNGEEIILPSNCYRGEYVREIANRLRVEYGAQFRRDVKMLYQDLPIDAKDGGDGDFYIDALIARSKDLLGKDDYEIIFQQGLQDILADIREDLEEFGVNFQTWFLESSLYKSGQVKESIDKLQKAGYVYEKDGALWFRATQFGDEKDRVVMRENGQYTYFASDIAYHFNKYQRGFDLMLDVLGADHHGYAPRIQAFLRAVGLDEKKLLIPLVQFAILYRGKTKVQMSTRSGEFVTLRDLRKEVGNDAARFFYIMRKNDQHLDFDLELAVSQSKDNPVYYIQYAHARISSVFRQMEEKNLTWDKASGLTELQLLKNIHEEDLLRFLGRYAETLQQAAVRQEPHVLAHYLFELANYFHAYYNAEQFLVDDIKLRNARLCLVTAVQQILKNALYLLGVSVPEVM